MSPFSLPPQAVVLAAGQSSRFEPFHTRSYHKSGTMLMGLPLIVRTVQALKKLGIAKIVVVHSPNDTVLPQALAAESVTLVVQPEAKGMGDALLRAAEHFEPGHFLALNPQHFNIADHLTVLADTNFPSDAIVVLSHATDQPQRYGMLGLDGNRVTAVTEKPASPEGLSNQRLMGIYLLHSSFLAFMQEFPVEEYQLENALDRYAQQLPVHAAESTAPPFTIKYAWDLFAIADSLFSQFDSKPAIDPSATVHPTALVEGPVVIEAGAQVFEYAIIKGPAYIGKNAVVGSYCKIRKGTVLEEGAEVQSHAEVKHSLIGAGTHLHSGLVEDSIVGQNARLGAGFITANRRFDRRTIRVTVKGEPIDTGSDFFGALIGDNASAGIHSGTNPGVIIPENGVIPPGTIVSNSKK
jgi:bifunctional UDP-N-acetylglucosamine pyrophosphorylase/glucosamine-1-phosphate N-acetyltransferase